MLKILEQALRYVNTPSVSSENDEGNGQVVLEAERYLVPRKDVERILDEMNPGEVLSCQKHPDYDHLWGSCQRNYRIHDAVIGAKLLKLYRSNTPLPFNLELIGTKEQIRRILSETKGDAIFLY